MILPIVLTGRLGLPGGGVPNFSLDSNGNVIGAEFWPQSSDASGMDPATGEPMTADSGSSGGFSNDPSLWTSGDPNASPNIIDIGSNWNTRGTQWDRIGSQRSESQFDKWRRAGRPTACSMSGLGDSTFPDGTPCTPGSSPLCLTTAQRILQGIAAGANVATGPQYYGITPVTQPQIAIGGSASTGAWILGGIAAVAVVFVLTRRR